MTWSGQRSRKIAAVTPNTSASTIAIDQPEERELQRQRQRGEHRVEHRRLGEHAGAHVALEQVADEAHVPHRQRVEQPVLDLELAGSAPAVGLAPWK